ncbi:MAG: hypothetical protein ABIA97_04600, partial [Candidatus Omnitrophota bacterium]
MCTRRKSLSQTNIYPLKFFVIVLIAGIFLLNSNLITAYAVLCGDGVKEGLEECDNGSNNSDTRANACRTDCVLPECGDGVIDNGEECDEGRSYNSDEIPGRCRRNCKAAKCGDGF